MPDDAPNTTAMPLQCVRCGRDVAHDPYMLTVAMEGIVCLRCIYRVPYVTPPPTFVTTTFPPPPDREKLKDMIFDLLMAFGAEPERILKRFDNDRSVHAILDYCCPPETNHA